MGKEEIYALKRQLEQIPAASGGEYLTKEAWSDTQGSVYILWDDGMKKMIIIGIFVVSVCLSFLQGIIFVAKKILN